MNSVKQAIAPIHSKTAPSFTWLVEKPIAHRGYHDEASGSYENSMSSLARTIEAGFTVECDLQITSDLKAAVFHDQDLTRMTSEQGPVRHRTSKELAQITLKDSSETIRTFDEYLEVTNGRVPLLVELKGILGEDNGLVQSVARSLANYKGEVAVMSFNHWIVAQFAEVIPDRPRGLTAMGNDNCYDFHMKAMRDWEMNFVSYRIHDVPCRFVKDLKERDTPVITWTVRTKEECDLTYTYGDQITFEGFDPRETCI